MPQPLIGTDSRRREELPQTKKPLRRLSNLSRSFSLLREENQELVSFSQTEILRSRFNLSSDAAVMTGFSYMGDLLMDFSAPRQVNDNLYRMALAAFEAVAQTPSDLDWVLRYFEVWLLKLEGFFAGPSRVRRMSQCIQWRRSIYLGPDLALRCLKCSAARGRAISKSVHQQMRATEKLSPAKFAEEVREVPVATKKRLAQLTYHIISRVLERMPRARPAFAQ